MRTFRALSFLFVFIFLISIPLPIAAADPLENVFFFGDSTTAHLVLRGGIPQDRVWSGVGNTVLFESVNRTKCVHLHRENRDLSLADAVALKKPPILIVTIGVSGGAGILSRESFVGIYRELLLSIQKASPQTRILVQSILPLSDRSVKYYKRLTKDAVVQANLWIRSLCMEMRIPYINTHDLLIDPLSGYLKKEYQNDEYMHLTGDAYQVILGHIRTVLRDASSG